VGFGWCNAMGGGGVSNHFMPLEREIVSEFGTYRYYVKKLQLQIINSRVERVNFRLM